MKVSVICITAREQCGLAGLIQSLEQQSMSVKDFELVYCDRLWDGRNKEMKSLLSASKLNYRYLKDDPPKPGPCPSTARNKCLAHARGEYIVSVDDLTLLPPGLLKGHYAYYTQGYDAVVASFEMLGEVREGLDTNPDTRVNTIDGLQKNPDEYPGYDTLASGESWAGQHFWGMHVGFSKDMAYKVNGYNALFDGVYGQEDVDIGIRMSHVGATFVWAPELKVQLIRDERHDSTHDTLLDKRKIPVPEALIQGHIRWRNDRLIALISQHRSKFRANLDFDISKGEWK